MPTPILMPALSPTMEEGKLAKWLVKKGQKVKSGDVIAEIETDKATMEVEAVDEGTVGDILVAEGTEGVKVNSQIAILLGEGESAGAASVAPAAAPPPSQPSLAQGQGTSAAASSSPREANAQRGEGRGEGQPQGVASSTAPPPQPSPSRGEGATPQPARAHSAAAGGERAGANGKGSRLFASPLAKRIAKERGLDLSAISGTGPHGRIVKADVEKAQSSPQARAVSAQGAAPAAAPAAPLAQPMPDKKIMALYEEGSFEVLPHDNMRKTIAKRLVEAKQTIPHFYLTVDCRLDELLAARKRLNARSPLEGPHAYKLSVNDFIIKALALGLRDVPAANATWTEGGMLRHKRIDVGVAVAIEGGLFTPLVRHADLKTLSEISNEMKDLAERARKRRLAPHEYQGGTTSISNLGMFGIKTFDAVINPPHATILAVGAGEEVAVVKDGKIEIATIMQCTMSCDHRVVDGALGAHLLNAFKAYIEDPVRMLV
ncbi:MAG: pyruvate dehydrogenase complex dihydrolipoamide acetyltransferase [Hyphomicrobiaceae bacterium]